MGLIDICEKILKQNDLKKIKKLFEEKIVYTRILYPELIEEVMELKKILNELLKDKSFI